MGCSNSKIHSDEAVARCKARRRFMKQAVDSRHAFAASHANYVIALKAVGSALRQFAEGEVKDPAAAGTPSDAPSSSLLKPPPLPPMSLNRRSSSLSSSPHLLRHRKTSSSFQSPEIEEVSSAPPPLITPIGYDEDWKYSIQAPPSRQGQPPPPPPISQSSWRDLFLDPFRPSSGPYQYGMSTQGESSLHDTFDTNYRHVPSARKENILTGAVTVNRELAMVIQEQGGRDLVDVLKEVDELFLKAADSAEKVSRILETKKVHYHSSFSESLQGQLVWTLSNMSMISEDSSSICSSMRSLGSCRSTAWAEDCGMAGSLVSTFDRLYVWEKKLYLEVKGAEHLRTELEKKYQLSRTQDAKGEDQVGVEKTQASIKMLQTSMAVAIQAVDGAAIEIQKLRDDELYPQLLDLLEAMMIMWKDMAITHEAQMKSVEAFKRLGNAAASEPTTSFHRHSTVELETALNKWTVGLERVVSTQRDLLKNLTGWLRISLMQFPEEMDRAGSCSPTESPAPALHSVGASPIYSLCQQWQASMAQLPDRVALEGIAGFAAVVREMLRLQWEELKIKKRVETFARELEKRESSLFSTSTRESQSLPLPTHSPWSPVSSSESEDNEYALSMTVREGLTERADIVERRQRVEASKRKLEEEQEAERKAYLNTRAYTLNSLQTGLPYLFQALFNFSIVEANIYEGLYALEANSKIARITDK
ncbi:unnamed protein product [Sphagnum balticum]